MKSTNSLYKILVLPISFLKLFTQDKSFGKNPIIGNYILNLMGLHIFRLLFAHLITMWRYFLLSKSLSPNQRKEFRDTGMLLIKNYLPRDSFIALQSEVTNYSGEVQRIIQGDSATDRVQINSRSANQLPLCFKLTQRAELKKKLRYCAATLVPCLSYIQAINHHINDRKPDPQKNTHIDTFHPTMKAWLYLVDVTPENGPFHYIPGSNKITWRRLKWEYVKSLENSQTKSGGSFRASAEDIRELGLKNPVPVITPANTLMIVNTFGLHCRGDARGKRTRFEIWFHSRTNPFNPALGGLFLLFEGLYEKLVHLRVERDFKKGKFKIIKANWQNAFK